MKTKNPLKQKSRVHIRAGLAAGVALSIAIPLALTTTAAWAQDRKPKQTPIHAKDKTPAQVGAAAPENSVNVNVSGSRGHQMPTPQMVPGLPVAIPAGVLAALQGTGVGNGGNSARDAYLQKLRAELTPQNGPSTQGDLTAWCGQVSSVLIREKQRAMMQYEYENLDQAEQILIDAMVTAAESLNDPNNPQPKEPMTLKILDRTLMYSQALDQALPSQDRLSQVTKLNFLFSSVDFIVNVAENLDPPYYIPYQYQYGGCYNGCPSQFPFPAFERAFVEMAAQELSFVVNDLTEPGNQDGNVTAYPLGNPKAFLTVAALVTNDVANDLSENLHAYQNACAIGQLDTLSQELSAYNLNGDHSVFPSDLWAVSEAASEMTGLANQIASDSPFCGNGY